MNLVSFTKPNGETMVINFDHVIKAIYNPQAIGDENVKSLIITMDNGRDIVLMNDTAAYVMEFINKSAYWLGEVPA